MKALTLTQPFASLVAIGQKKIETRSWQTSYRGPLAIHAAKGFPVWARELVGKEPFRSALCDVGRNGQIDWWGKDVRKCLPVGCVLAFCDLVDIYPTEEVGGQSTGSIPKPPYRQNGLLRISGLEIAFGDYSPGRFAWRLKNIRPLPEPIPAKGAMGLWEWDRC